jgi:tetratricopeptide (TPR) repeat protein
MTVSNRYAAHAAEEVAPHRAGAAAHPEGWRRQDAAASALATAADSRTRDLAPSAVARVLSGPAWSLRIEGQRLAVVLERAPLPGGAELVELAFGLPHVAWPFDFRDGIERFRHQRGAAEELALRIDARLALDWLYRATGGAIGGSARDDALVLVGRTEGGTRYTVRARLVADERDPLTGEPLLQLSLYQLRVYGPVDTPWPVLAGRILDALPPELVVDRTLTTARLRLVRRALAFALASLGWKVPDVQGLESRGVELREGRFTALFASATTRQREVITLAPDSGEIVQTAFERFIEDLELKRHHGQIDRLIAAGQFRDALSEVYRAVDGPLRPGFLAERLIGICASQPILFDEGERVCFQLLEKHGDYPQALCGLGAIARARGRAEEAAMYFERLASALSGPGEREDATAADLAVADCLRDFAPEQARLALERVLGRAPDHEEALSERIAMAEAEADMRTAMPLYKRLLFSARSQARTRDAGLRLARFALERGEPEDARVLLRVVLEAAPDDLDAQMALADVEAGDGHAAEAVRILEQALRTLPPQDTPRVLRVIVRLAQISLELLADPGRARRILWRAGDFARLGDTSLRELASLSVRARDAALALRFIELIPSASAEWSEGQTLKAEALLLRGDTAGALRSVLAVLAREPDHEEALRLLERTAPDPEQRQWLVAELLDSAERAVPGEPRARVLHRVAAMYVSLGLPWDAISPLETALGESPGFGRFEERAALLMGLHQQFGMWSDYLRVGALRLPELRRAPPSDEGAQRRRTGLLVDLGRAALRELDDPRGARGWLEEATRLAPRHLEAHELLAESLCATPEREAMQALSHVLMRLESIRPDEVTRDAARLQLTELQLNQLQSPVLARATLQRLTPGRRLDPWVLALEQQVATRLDNRRASATPARTTAAPMGQPEQPAAARTTAPTGQAPRVAGPVPPSEPTTDPLARPAVALASRATPPLAPPDLPRTAPPATTRSSSLEAPRFPLPEPRVARPASHELPPTPAAATQAPTPAPEVANIPRVDTRTRLSSSPRPAATRTTERVEADDGVSLDELSDLVADALIVPDNAGAARAILAAVVAQGPEPVPPAASRPPARRLPPPRHQPPTAPTVAARPRPPGRPEGAPADEAGAETEDALRSAPAELASLPEPAGLERRAAEMDAIEGLLLAASEHLFSDRLAEARTAVHAVLAIDGDVVPALELLSAIEEAAGDGHAQASALGRLVRNTFDNSALARLSRALGDVLDGLGRGDEALIHHARQLQLEPLDLGRWGQLARRLPAAAQAEILEARVDAAEDAELPELRTRSLAAAAEAHLAAGDRLAAAHAAGRASVAEAGDDPELLLLLFSLAGEFGLSPLRDAAAGALKPLLLPGPDLDAVTAALAEA